MREIKGDRPIRVWEPEGCPTEPGVYDQARAVASLPCVEAVCLMPDHHVGFGGPVGGVIPTRFAVVPALAGVDLGCGMAALKTDVQASELDGKLPGLRLAIESAIPHGGPGVRGSWSEQGRRVPAAVSTAWAAMQPGFAAIVARYPRIAGRTRHTEEQQLCTLGTGNHFVEVCLDGSGTVWLMLHSGSRGAGNRIGTYFISEAREYCLKLDRTLPDKDLGWLDDGTQLFADYMGAVNWAQGYARLNRDLMMYRAVAALEDAVERPVRNRGEAVNCHHNYVESAADGLYVTRKGAVSARAGELGIIPGSMGARSFIVRGLGNLDSYESCSHGAGRRMSRGRANKEISLEQHRAALAGVECRADETTLDESPSAYKNIDAVMAAQADLVSVVAVIKQIVCVKG